MSPSTTSKVTIDHAEIRRWAEARGAKPAAVARTENAADPGIIRLEFSGAPDGRDTAREEIGWDEWFEKFDEYKLALLHQEQTAGGERSNFNRIISRDTAEEVSSAVGGKGRSASHKHAGTSTEISTGAGMSGSGRRSSRSEGRQATKKRVTLARGHGATSERTSTRRRYGQKRATSADRGGATRGSAARSSRTTSRAQGRHRSAGKSSPSQSTSR